MSGEKKPIPQVILEGADLTPEAVEDLAVSLEYETQRLGLPRLERLMRKSAAVMRALSKP